MYHLCISWMYQNIYYDISVIALLHTQLYIATGKTPQSYWEIGVILRLFLHGAQHRYAIIQSMMQQMMGKNLAQILCRHFVSFKRTISFIMGFPYGKFPQMFPKCTHSAFKLGHSLKVSQYSLRPRYEFDDKKSVGRLEKYCW